MAYMPALSYEAIADGLTVCTSSLHRFGTDAVLLTEFSGYRQKTASATSAPAAALSPC